MQTNTQEETNSGDSLVELEESSAQWVNQNSFFINCLRRYCWLQDNRDIVSPSNSDEYTDKVSFPLSASSEVLLGDESSRLSCRHVTSPLDVLYLIRNCVLFLRQYFCVFLSWSYSLMGFFLINIAASRMIQA